MTNDYQYWDNLRGKVKSGVGVWKPNRGTTAFGRDMHRDIVINDRYFQYWLQASTGKVADKNLARFIEATFLFASWPDPRIWCNSVGVLAAETGCGAPTAVALGIMASDSYMYGPRPGKNAAGVVIKGVQLLEQGKSIPEIAGIIIDELGSARKIPGFSRPLVNGDERVEACQKLAREFNFSVGPHEDFALSLGDYLFTTHGEAINLGAYSVAVLLDQGFELDDIERQSSTCVQAGVMACYVDAIDRPKGTFMPLRCEDVEYVGVESRPLP